MWYMDGDHMKTHQDNRCMDWNRGNNNVEMHGCHSGNNQKWYFDDKQRLKSRDGNKCVDYSLDGSNNVYMYDCHDGDNQAWYLETKIDKLVSPQNAIRASHTVLDVFADAQVEVELPGGTTTFSASDCPEAISQKGHWHVFTYDAKRGKMQWACGDDIPSADAQKFHFMLKGIGQTTMDFGAGYNASADPENWEPPEDDDASESVEDSVTDLENLVADANASRLEEIHQHAADELEKKIKSGALRSKFLGRAAGFL